jgi:23S rRNA pseudouridine2605 synthase
MQERLQKIIARAGIASRRKAEELIQQGQVTVNGQLVTELGSKADAGRDHIKVRGKLLRDTHGERIYLMLNKPRECVSTTSDPEGRRTVMDLVGRYSKKVYPVGRLDYHTEGLLLLTNDGDFANHVLSAKKS